MVAARPPAAALSRLRPWGSAALLGLALALPAPARSQVLRNGPLPPLFPADNWWNVDVSGAPVAGNSAALIGFYGGATTFHPDFGGDADDPSDPGDDPDAIYGMPYISVPGTQPRVPVTFVEYGSQSDVGFPGLPTGYPIPEEAKTQAKWYEGGQPGNRDPDDPVYLGDRHMLIVDRDNRVLYELYHAHWNAALNRWQAGSAAIYSLDGNDRRPDTWTSADAAGLAILPGLIRYDEAYGTQPIRHAFRVTFSPSADAFVFPASHEAGSNNSAFPMGARLRLKAGVVPENVPNDATQADRDALARIFQALETYGLIVADNGSDGYVQGVYDTRWDNGVLNPVFHALRLDDFEVVEHGWQPSNALPATPRRFHTATPCRLLDTRLAAGPQGSPPLWPAWTVTQRPGAGGAYQSPNWRVVKAHGVCGIPLQARALSVNVTIANPGTTGTVSFFPGDTRPPLPVNRELSFAAGQTRANNAILALAASGSGTFGVRSSAAVPVHVVVDVNGWFE